MADSLPLADAAVSTRLGKGHERNDDAFLVMDGRVDAVRKMRRGVLYAVADGVSSVPDGYWASHVTCDRLASFFEPEIEPRLEGFLQLINEIDWEIRGRGQGKAASTLSALWLSEGMAHVMHVGDSEVFWIRHGQLHRITDQDRGGRRLRHYMGMGPSVNEVIRVWQEPFFEGDIFILTTDGVMAVVEAAEILELSWQHRGSARNCAQDIIRLADERQGRDDSTVIVVDVIGSEDDGNLFSPATN